VEGEHRCLLLLRFDLPDQDLTLWATPGGGIESGESVEVARVRELVEEVGLELSDRPVTHVWSERVVGEGHAKGYDGVINDFFLVDVPRRFDPQGSPSHEDLVAENISGHRWWSSADLLNAQSGTVFGPRRLPSLFAELLKFIPTTPISL
jgi:8-oxo-dGTP diphosphatase